LLSRWEWREINSGKITFLKVSSYSGSFHTYKLWKILLIGMVRVINIKT
jgi:hypothetical protein